MALRLALPVVFALLAAPASAVGSSPEEPGDWWSAKYTELHSKQSAAITFLRFETQGPIHEIGLTTESFQALPFVLPLLPLGEVEAETLAYRVENQRFQPLPRSLANGTTWDTQWGEMPLRGEVAQLTSEHVWIRFTGDEGKRFSDLEYDPRTHVVVRHTVFGVGSAEVFEYGSNSACHGVYPHRVERFPVHSMIGEGEDPTSRIGRHLIVEGDHDYIALHLMAATYGSGDVARINLVSPAGEMFEASAGSTAGPDHDTELALAVAATGLWQATETTTPGGDVSLKAVGVKHALRATGGFAPMESDMCHLHDKPAPASIPVAFPGESSVGGLSLGLLASVGFVAFASALWYLARSGRLGFLLPLFVKLTRHQVEHQHVRKAIVDLIHARPGLTTQQIRTELDLAWGEAVHHVQVLQQGGILTAVPWGRHRHWFDQRQVTAADRSLLTALRHAPARRMLEALWTTPGTRQEDLSGRLGLHRATLQFHARKLSSLGLIDRRREAAKVRYYPLVPKPAMPTLILAHELLA